MPLCSPYELGPGSRGILQGSGAVGTKHHYVLEPFPPDPLVLRTEETRATKETRAFCRAGTLLLGTRPYGKPYSGTLEIGLSKYGH